MIRHKDQVFDGQQDSIVDSETWRKTQARLENNRVSTKLRSKAKTPSLLAGLIFDSNGNPMSPTHTTKNGRRYRYYISQALLKYESDKAGSVTRVPAADIEGSVLKQIEELLIDKIRLLQITQLESSRIARQRKVIEKGTSLARSLDRMDSHELIVLLNSLVDQVRLNQEKLTIFIKRKELVQLLSSAPDSSVNNSAAEIKLTSSIHIKRYGLENKMIIGEKSVNEGHPLSISAIQNAVFDALRWSESLLSGKARTVTELASEEGVSQRYLSSLMHLSFLAPDIVEAISKGSVPMGLSLEKLKRGFPLDWKEQHQLLGF